MRTSIVFNVVELFTSIENLTEIIISSNNFQQNLKKLPTAISVIDSKLLEKSNSINISSKNFVVLKSTLPNKMITVYGLTLSILGMCIFNIGLTPNRSDAMSHLGVARDLRAALMHKGFKLELITPSVSSFHVNSRTQKININIENIQSCRRFSGVCIDNIIVKESPIWLKNRLKSIGLSPLNNVVDNVYLTVSVNPLPSNTPS